MLLRTTNFFFETLLLTLNKIKYVIYKTNVFILFTGKQLEYTPSFLQHACRLTNSFFRFLIFTVNISENRLQRRLSRRAAENLSGFLGSILFCGRNARCVRERGGSAHRLAVGLWSGDG